jgi:DUF4097 and DUF4098 domain-containing protein YvlB
MTMTLIGFLLFSNVTFAKIKTPAPTPTPTETPALDLKEFIDEIHGRDFILRSTGNLRITNLRGSITVQGWSFDKIRVKARRKVMAANEEEARKLREFVDFRYSTSHKNEIELSAEYGKGQDIKDRVRERNNPRANMDIHVFVPPNFSVSLLTISGDISVINRNADVDMRTTSGHLSATGVDAKQISTLCSDCEGKFKNIKSSIHAMGGSKSFEISNVVGKKIYIETQSGDIRAKDVTGEQFYISHAGSIAGQQLSGLVEFVSQEGKVDLKDVQGSVSGRTDFGEINIGVKNWNFHGDALLESQRGNIAITLPKNFSGDVDIRSSAGQISIEFPLRKPDEQDLFGPKAAQHLMGKIGKGGELLKVVSDKGDVKVQRGS